MKTTHIRVYESSKEFLDDERIEGESTSDVVQRLIVQFRKENKI